MFILQYRRPLKWRCILNVKRHLRIQREFESVIVFERWNIVLESSDPRHTMFTSRGSQTDQILLHGIIHYPFHAKARRTPTVITNHSWVLLITHPRLFLQKTMYQPPVVDFSIFPRQETRKKMEFYRTFEYIYYYYYFFFFLQNTTISIFITNFKIFSPCGPMLGNLNVINIFVKFKISTFRSDRVPC